MERIDKPMLDAKSANIQFGFDRNTGNDVMHVKNLEIGYQTAITKPMSIEVSERRSYSNHWAKWYWKIDLN